MLKVLGSKNLVTKTIRKWVGMVQKWPFNVVKKKIVKLKHGEVIKLSPITKTRSP